MQKISIVLVLLAFSIVATAQQRIRVAVAANLMLPMAQIKTQYERDFPEVAVELIGASSGKLTAQIQNSAPFHIFLSADMHYPKVLYQQGFLENPPQTVALGLLVFWSKNPLGDKTVQDCLKESAFRTLAIAQPELAPYGNQASKWMKERGLYEKIVSKLVYGESIGKVNQYIYAQTVDAAFTAVSALHAEQLMGLGHWKPLQQSPDDGIPHGGALIRYGTEAEKQAARLFFDYLFSQNARSVFREFGYGIPSS